ncbi:MAG: acetylornithine transaminase [bacterium]
MTSTTDLIALGNEHNSPSYAPGPLVIDRGERVTLFDHDGAEYLDFVAGIAVNALGHGHPELVKAIQEQAAKLLHVSNMFYTEPQIRLMDELCRLSFADRVFLCNSGAEANEAAFKLARRFQKVVAGKPNKTKIISMKNSFHGRTLAAVTATGQPKYHKGFEPLVPDFLYATFNDLDSIAALADETTAAIIVEPVQGEGGIVPSAPGFLAGLRALCDDVGALLIFDEVQAGIARTGTMFAYEYDGVAPDIMALAKGLGGGVPIGACIATDHAFEGFERGSHASTFGGNPLASAAALCVLEVIQRDGLCQNATARGEELMAGLRDIAAKHDVVEDVRGRGLMVGAQCAGTSAGDIVTACRDEGLLVNIAGGNTIRFVPPLIVTEADVTSALTRFETAVSKWSNQRAA